MKRYLLFRGDLDRPGGGWRDFVADFATLHVAMSFADPDELKGWGAWVDIVDTETGTVTEVNRG